MLPATGGLAFTTPMPLSSTAERAIPSKNDPSSYITKPEYRIQNSGIRIQDKKVPRFRFPVLRSSSTGNTKLETRNGPFSIHRRRNDVSDYGTKVIDVLPAVGMHTIGQDDYEGVGRGMNPQRGARKAGMPITSLKEVPFGSGVF